MKTQPMAGDFVGNHFFQLLLFDSQKGERMIYIFQDDQTINLKPFKQLQYADTDKECINYNKHLDFADIHFSAVVDFTGDCRADLVIHTQTQIEFWAKISDQYCLQSIQKFQRKDSTLISFNFNDVNFDGSVDIVALVKENTSYDLVIMYNQYSTSASNLCSRYSGFPYQEISVDSEYVQYQQLNLDVFENLKGIAPTQIRFSDVNWDGMQDIVIIIKSTSNPNLDYGFPVVLINSSCEDDYCKTLKVSNKREFQQSKSSNYNDMYKVEAVNIAFFDVNEDGKIDYMVNTFENGQYNIRCFFNYISTDAFFLKALGLNGQCTSSSCQSSVYYGSSYQCKVTTLDTDYKTATGVQLSQSAHCPLQLPFVILGLARTNNYIENFTIGLPQPDVGDSKRVWTPIIPNSQLIVFPYTQDTQNWEITIFVQPNDALIIVIIVTFAILILLGAIIVYYHRKEKQEEIKNQQEFLKMIR